MRLAHIADTHLGFRRGYRETPAHINQWEQDTANAFRQVVDAVILARPDVVVIAGDLFHGPRPLPIPVVFCFEQLRRLRAEGLPVCVIGGNHDYPKKEPGTILPLFLEAGVQVATTRAEVFQYPGLAITAVPYAALRKPERWWIEPSGEGTHVLLAHGVMEGQDRSQGAEPVIPLAAIRHPGWAYVALGDYHITDQVAPCAWYAGSTGYTSSDIWAELPTPKAWLLVDLETGTVEPQRIRDQRPIYDLDPIYADGLTPAEVNQAMAEAIAQVPDFEGAVVRLPVMDIERAVTKQLDHKAILRWRAEALEFRLIYQYPTRREVRAVTAGHAKGRKTLAETVRDHLNARELPPGMDREAFVRLGTEAFDSDDYCGGTRVQRAAETALG